MATKDGEKVRGCTVCVSCVVLFRVSGFWKGHLVALTKRPLRPRSHQDNVDPRDNKWQYLLTNATCPIISPEPVNKKPVLPRSPPFILRQKNNQPPNNGLDTHRKKSPPRLPNVRPNKIRRPIQTRRLRQLRRPIPANQRRQNAQPRTIHIRFICWNGCYNGTAKILGGEMAEGRKVYEGVVCVEGAWEVGVGFGGVVD